MNRTRYVRTALGVFVGVLVLLLTSGGNRAMAHKEKHTPDQLKAFEDVFMDQVKIGDLLFHGDGATEKKLRLGQPSLRVPQVPGADQQVRDAPRHDQLVHREAQRGGEDRS